MKTEILSIIGRYIILLISLISCSPKDSFRWSAGMSAPVYYGNGGPRVEYFYKGKSITGVSANIGFDPGWGTTSGGYTTGEEYKLVPDSISITWICAVDGIEYAGGTKLPREKMLGLFREGFTDAYGKHSDYGLIIAGMAPGGNVTIWMGGERITEISKFKVQNMGVWMENDRDYNDLYKKNIYSEEFINSETNIFRYLHGVPYEVWEKGEKEYDYDISFSSKVKEYNYDFSIISKDGSYFIDEFSEFIDWERRFSTQAHKIRKKKKLPIQINMQWHSKDEKNWYEGKIIMPQTMQKKFNNMLISVEEYNNNFAHGQIYLLDKGVKNKLMEFRLGRYDYEKQKLMFPKYSLPRNFKFPKWQGRVQYPKPNFEYWQEH